MGTEACTLKIKKKESWKLKITLTETNTLNETNTLLSARVCSHLIHIGIRYTLEICTYAPEREHNIMKLLSYSDLVSNLIFGKSNNTCFWEYMFILFWFFYNL